VKLARNVRLSLKALLRHWVRTLLALSGSALGVGAVLVMISIGEGAEGEILAQIEALGRNMVVVNAGDAPRPVSRARTARKVTTLRLADVEPLLAGSPAIALAAPAQDGGRRVKFGTINMFSTVRATTPEWAEVRSFAVTAGRFFTHEENEAGARVGVIGSKVQETLFAGIDPVGQILRVGRVPIEIVGVLESKGATIDGLSEEDNQVVVPINTGLRRIFNVDWIKMIYVQVAEDALMDDAIAQMSAVLRTRHRLQETGREDDFTMQNQALVLEAEIETVASFRRMINGLGAVALIVGGVGILAIMLLSVKERTNEVGLRVAVGARRRDIRVQFLAEALMLGGLGGGVGVVLGLGAAWIIGITTEWSTTVTPGATGIALGSALLIGVVFGVIPAQKAAAMDPIEALRAE